MNITDKVKIGAMVYNVEFKDIIDNNNDLDGQIVYSANTIQIRKVSTHSEDYEKMVFLHEIIHGIFNHCNIDQDENKIELIGNALYMVIKDNPELFK